MSPALKSIVVIASALLSFVRLHAAEMSIKVLGHTPEASSQLAYLDTEQSKGFRCFWEGGDERRDLGQVFEVDQAQNLTALYLKINSGNKHLNESLPLRLVFGRWSDGKPGSVLAEYEGNLHSSASNLRSGAWLQFHFPSLELEQGKYYFLLQFREAGGPGQSIVFNVNGTNGAYAKGDGLYSLSTNSEQLVPSRPMNFILSDESTDKPLAEKISGRTLVVDQRGGADFTSLADAAEAVNPGDTIILAPGSGPYREPLFIRKSGRPDAPIVVDGNGEVITGFEPLTGFHKQNDVLVCDMPEEFPQVIVYQGERLLQNPQTSAFEKYATLSEDGKQLILKSGTSAEGWAISSRYFAVRVENVSWHTYRNIKTCGAINDGFNLHGKGEGLVFENIEGYQNLDEGFSAHDEIHCVIRGGRFYSNDNGIGNVGDSSMTASQLEVYDNLGWGIWLNNNSTASLDDVELWGNGLTQLCLSGKNQLTVTQVTAQAPVGVERPWVSYKESRKAGRTKPVLIGKEAVLHGEINVVNN